MWYEIREITENDYSRVQEYLVEFLSNNEQCNVLWMMKPDNVKEWLDSNLHSDAPNRSKYYSFVVTGRIVGICRITEKPTYAANGQFGYAIRPSERGKGYASEMIRSITNDIAKKRLTACVSENNVKSLKAFAKAGWVPSGITYTWINGETAIEFVPKTIV